MKAVIFDLFETLITEWNTTKYTTRNIATDLDVDCQIFRNEWESLHMDRYLGKLFGTTQVYKRILDKMGITRDEDLLVDISKRRDECKKLCFKNIDPRIIDMLSCIKARGLKIGLISNCSNEEIQGLEDCDLYQFFDAIVLSSKVGCVKPNPEIYDKCMTLLSVDPSDCLYVGDGGSNELWGAGQVGLTPLKAVWFSKIFVKGFDSDKSYPFLEEPSEIFTYI